MSKPNGGPAFPIPDEAAGMTLRDWFAGKALEGLLAQAWHPEMGWTPGYGTHADAAQEAFAIADAMIAVREVLS